jgi:hypothetical protein
VKANLNISREGLNDTNGSFVRATNSSLLRYNSTKALLEKKKVDRAINMSSTRNKSIDKTAKEKNTA